ncbi:MamK family actin-like protein [Desulfurivibrio sp. D14AmB]|uniref:MamK family actin-like protein n=1 Tax=Desulfurivibrio sp. D14AmB TaxID=3374370 RepID=UPI00376F4112
MPDQEHNGEQLLLGIDLGSTRTAVVSNLGYQNIIHSVVGYPKDIIALKMVGQPQVFGDEALEKKSALTLYYPLREGAVLRDGKQDYDSAFELLRHVIELATQGQSGPAGGIIGISSRTSSAGKEYLTRIAAKLLSPSLVIADPFLVGYHLNQLDNCLIIDIGAGTVDICVLKGAAPAARDQVNLLKAGDYIDQQLYELISQRHPEVQLSRDLARRIKERHAFVGQVEDPVIVRLRVGGKPKEYDLTSEMKMACESIVPDIIERLTILLQSMDPEDLDTTLQNIYLTGGGARIRHLEAMVADSLRDYGRVRVSSIDDPEYAGARGALRLAASLGPGQWPQLG